MEFIGPKLRRRHFGSVGKVSQTLPVRLSFLHERYFVHRVVVIVLSLLVTAMTCASDTTQIVDGKIAQVTERGFILQVGSEHITVEDTSATKFWRAKATVKRDAFRESDLVTARIKTNLDPPELRELADRDSWKWVDGIRKQPQCGTVEKVDDKYVTLKFADGSSFAYRATEKSKVALKDKPNARFTDLEPGQRVFAKGRTLATLDTWLVEVTDSPIASKPTKDSGKKAPKPKPLPASGKLDGLVLGHLAQFHMFDMIHQIATLHITYNEHTKFWLNGKPVKSSAIQPNHKVVITYTRDKYGRIVASKVELFGS